MPLHWETLLKEINNKKSLNLRKRLHNITKLTKGLNLFDTVTKVLECYDMNEQRVTQALITNNYTL